MVKYISTLLFGLTLVLASAQVVEIQKTVLCSTPEKLFTELAKEHRERIYWAGHGEQSSSTYILWVNARANTWTLTQSNKEVSCIIGSGNENRLLLGPEL